MHKKAQEAKTVKFMGTSYRLYYCDVSFQISQKQLTSKDFHCKRKVVPDFLIS